MSFSFKSKHPEPVKVINNTNDVLMFAASPNFGATEDPPIRFPARVKHEVIFVNSSDGLGHPSDLSAPYDESRDNFSILGEDVPLGKKGNPGSEEMVYTGQGPRSQRLLLLGYWRLYLSSRDRRVCIGRLKI
jgi:hypothetical protein